MKRTKPEEVDVSVLHPEIAGLINQVIFHPDCPQDLIDGIYDGCWNINWVQVCERWRAVREEEALLDQ